MEKTHHYTKVIRYLCIAGALLLCVYLETAGGEYLQGRKEYERLAQVCQKKEGKNQGALPDIRAKQHFLGTKGGEKSLQDGVEDGGGDGTKDWEEKLRAVNPDYAGWLYIPGTDIDYPVVMAESPDYYLTHTFEGRKNSSGCLFMDPETDGLGSGNVIIFGHNRKDGSMFGGLKRYQEREFGETHREIMICCAGRWQTGRMFSCGIFKQGDQTPYQYRFSSREEREDYLAKMKSKSLYCFTDGPGESEQIVTLSSCLGKSQWVIVQAAVLCYTE